MGTKKRSSVTRERLYLLDGMALAYRAYFSFISRPLINSKGENTSAIFGFVNTLMKILDVDKPEHIAVVFDTKEPTFRHIMYKPYKATREKMPDEMANQLSMLKDVVKAFNVPCLELPGYEADDIMGTLARRAERQGIDTFLVTGDKDFMQLISPAIRMYKPGKGGDDWEIVDESSVKEKFGVTPDRVIDVLALTGDSSDNVPGVKGIGEKTAIPLIQQYGSLEALLEHVDAIPQKGLQEKLREHRDIALLSKKLVTIDVNVPIEADVHHLVSKPKDNDLLRALFAQLEFRSLLKRFSSPESPVNLPGSAEPAGPVLTDMNADEHVYHIITTEKELKNLASLLKKSKLFVIDTETTGLDAMQAELVGLSFALRPREAYYVPVLPPRKSTANLPDNREDLFGPLHDGSKSSRRGNQPDISEETTGLDPAFVLETLAPLLRNPDIRKVGQNIKFDMLVLAAHGIRIEGIAFDTMVANYILRPDARHNMDDMAADHLRYKTVTYDDLTGTGKDRSDLRSIPVEKVGAYAAEDADITFRLFECLQEKLTSQGLLDLCRDVEFPLVSVLAEMEYAGVALDTLYLADLSKELERALDNLTTEIYRQAGEQFNINSTQQLSKILFEKLRLTTGRKTKTGYSTDVSVLEELRHHHPVIDNLLEYRQLQKLKSTYIDALPALVNPVTKRLHTSFNQTIAATGRLSSSNPNLQNIPIRTEIGRNIRHAFVSGAPGLVILSADYSQIELRIMAHVSGDEGLAEAFRNNEDIHATTAAKVFGIPLKEVTKDMRRKAKEVNFGIMYGIGPFGLANRLDIAQSEAKSIIETYFQRFPKVKQYIADTLAGAKADGYVSTLLGRRRYLPEINDRNFTVRSNAERQAINMPIQGTAADMIKVAMINITRRLSNSKLDVKMLLQVHDELVFEVKKSDVKGATKLIVKEMREALPLSVPVEVEAGSGKNWLEAH